MENWYEVTMNNSKLKEEFFEKINEEDCERYELVNKPFKSRDNSWVRKRIYRKKMVRNFLFLNPSMKLNEVDPLHSINGVYIKALSTNGDEYNINHVSHIYISPRGKNHLEVFRGALEWGRTGRVFGIGCKNRDIGKITNRRIRHMKTETEIGMKHSYCKKKFAPKMKEGIL